MSWPGGTRPWEAILLAAAYGDRRSILTWDDSALRWVGTFVTLLATVVVIWANATWSNPFRGAGSSTLPHPVLLSGRPFRWIRYPGLLSMGLALASSTKLIMWRRKQSRRR